MDALLKRQRKWVTFRTEDEIEFDGSLLSEMLPPHFRAMIAINRGRFEIQENASGLELSYELESLHMLIFAIIGAALFVAFVGSVEGLPRGIAVGSIMFLWIYGGHWAITKARLPALIRETVS